MSSPKDGAAWITGASSGIGRSLALRLAHEGWTVLATARRAEALEELAQQSDGPNGRILARPADVTDRDSVRKLVEDTEQEMPIALAVLSAGTFKGDNAEQFSSEDFKKTVEVNLVGTAHCIEALMPAWIRRRRGHLAVISSVAGYRGLPTSISYGASKAALINMCEALKFDFDRLGLKVQVINPGFVRTPLTDQNEFKMPFLMEADDAADRIARGLKKSSFEIAFPLRFACMLKQLRCLPYEAYFPLVRRTTGK